MLEKGSFTSFGWAEGTRYFSNVEGYWDHVWDYRENRVSQLNLLLQRFENVQNLVLSEMLTKLYVTK